MPDIEFAYDVADPKHPSSSEPYFVVFCDKDGTNVAGDEGDLQGETISSATWTVPTGLTKGITNTSAVIISGVSYPANTVATCWFSGGTDGTYYEITVSIITSGGRTLAKTFILPVTKRF